MQDLRASKIEFIALPALMPPSHENTAALNQQFGLNDKNLLPRSFAEIPLCRANRSL
jgi:hypothetical protein